ncbi:MAG: lipid II flippase MurJ [Minisyncoccia bacterium]
MMMFLRSSRDTIRKTYTGAGWALSFLTTEVRGLQAAAYILALSSLFSSLLALLRDRILANMFGAGSTLDIYYAAFRIPDAVFIGIGALVSAYMLIPELARRDEAAQTRYLDSVIGGFAALVTVVSLVAAWAAPTILVRTFPALVAQGSLDELIALTRILLFQAALLGFSNIAAAVTQFKHRYALYALSPIVYNLGIIFGAYVLYPILGLSGLAWGVVIGAAFHFGIQVPSIVSDGFFRHLPQSSELSAFLETVRLSLPRALALSMNQIAFFALLALAGTLSAGSISVFMFAYNLQGVPLAIIGASYATAAFPTLAYAFSQGKSDVFLTQMGIAARQIIFWSLPAIALMIVLRAHVVRAVLGSGAFDWTDTRLTAAALALFAISLAAQGISLLLIRACYASGKTLVPFVISGLSSALMIFLGVQFLSLSEYQASADFLETFLRVEDLLGTQILALALAYSLASLISAFALTIYFQFRFGTFFMEIGRSLGEGFMAAFAAAAASYSTLHVIGDISLSSTFLSVLLKGGTAGLVGCAAAAFAYFLLGNREYGENALALRRRIWKDVEPVTSAEQTA